MLQRDERSPEHVNAAGAEPDVKIRQEGVLFGGPRLLSSAEKRLFMFGPQPRSKEQRTRTETLDPHT